MTGVCGGVAFLVAIAITGHVARKRRAATAKIS